MSDGGRAKKRLDLTQQPTKKTDANPVHTATNKKRPDRSQEPSKQKAADQTQREGNKGQCTNNTRVEGNKLEAEEERKKHAYDTICNETRRRDIAELTAVLGRLMKHDFKRAVKALEGAISKQGKHLTGCIHRMFVT